MTSRTLVIRRRTAVALAGVVALLGAVVHGPAARADPGGPDSQASAVVTRLSVTDGRGWVTIQARIGAGHIVGFGLRLPAAGGTWGGAADVAVPELGIHCRASGAPDLSYTCGQPDDPEGGGYPHVSLPPGSYQVTLPVTRTGGVASLPVLAGRSWVVALDG